MDTNLTTRLFILSTVLTTSQAPSFFYFVYHYKSVILFHFHLAYKRPKPPNFALWTNSSSYRICMDNWCKVNYILYELQKYFLILIIDFDVVGKTRWKWITVVSVNCKKLAGKNLVSPKKWEVNATDTVVYLPNACVKKRYQLNSLKNLALFGVHEYFDLCPKWHDWH